MPGDTATQEGSSELTTAQRALVDSFKAVVREQVKDASGQQKAEDLGHLQVVFLVVLALDITLLYLVLIDLIPGAAENRVVVFLEKLLPVLSGTLVVSYFDRLRRWQFKYLTNVTPRIVLVALLGLLFAMKTPIYSLFVQLDPRAEVEVKVDDKDARIDEAGKFLLVSFKLQPYRVLLHDGRSNSNPWFEYQAGPGAVLKGTLARLPLLDKRFKPMKFAAAYEFTIKYRQESGKLYIAADPGFRLNQPVGAYQNSQLHRVPPATAPRDACPLTDSCWSMEIESTHVFALPRGDYIFTQENGECIERKPIAVSGHDPSLIFEPRRCK